MRSCMVNKTCILIVKDDKVFITKENDEWSFPILVATKEDKLFCDIDQKIVSSFGELIKNDGIHIYSLYNEKYINGEFCSLKIEIKDFNPNNYQDFKWIILEDIDTIRWNEESNTLVKELKIYLNKQLYSIRIDENKIWSDTCSLLEVERKFGEIIREQAHKYHVTKEISKWKTIRLYDENGIEIRRES